jgi:hypothetical protein
MISRRTKCGGLTHRFIGSLPVDEIRSQISAIEASAWTRYRFRKADVNTYVQTIPLYWQTNDWKLNEPIVVNRFMEFSALFPWIERVQQEVQANGIQDGVVVKAMLASLQPHQTIKSHIDGTHSLIYSQRCHWVISSDPSVKMVVEGIDMHWPEEHLYELNNLKVHGVHNDSDRPRLHMIVDIIPRSYVLNPVQYRDLTWKEYEMISDDFTTRHMVNYDK